MPIGGEATAIPVPAGLTVSATGPEVVLVGLLESVALTVRFAVPATVGVPDTRQLAPSVRPACNVPEVMLQE